MILYDKDYYKAFGPSEKLFQERKALLVKSMEELEDYLDECPPVHFQLSEHIAVMPKMPVNEVIDEDGIQEKFISQPGLFSKPRRYGFRSEMISDYLLEGECWFGFKLDDAQKLKNEPKQHLIYLLITPLILNYLEENKQKEEPI